MRNCNDFYDLIKKSAISAVESTKPVIIRFGKVKNENPLEITIEQKLTLSSEFLILTQNVVSSNGYITINGETKSVIIDRSLKKDDVVLMFRMQGGQKYLVFDKVV